MLLLIGMVIVIYVVASLLEQTGASDVVKITATFFITLMVYILCLMPFYNATPIQHTEKVMLQPVHDGCYVVSFGANVLINDGIEKRMVFPHEPIAVQKLAKPVLIKESGRLNWLLILVPPKKQLRIIVSKVEDIDFNGQDVNLTYIEKEK